MRMLTSRSSLAPLALLALCLLAVAPGCDEDAGGEDTGSDEPGYGVAAMPTWTPELGADVVLEEIAAEDIAPTCESLAEVLREADARLACRIAAVAETDDPAACSALVSDCLEAPEDALAQSTVTAAPKVVECSKFTAEATAGCTFTIGDLVTCVDALSKSLEPSSESVSCEKAADFEDLESANREATAEQGVQSYVARCKPLEACESLVLALLGD
jgi:hypothetical protein